ncbi:MAG: helix-turn-helix domain-containing protein [Gemmatimonadota bacterium]
MQIKLLAREGVPKSQIARRLGISRQTVYNHLKRTEPFPKKRAKRGSKLDRFGWSPRMRGYAPSCSGGSPERLVVSACAGGGMTTCDDAPGSCSWPSKPEHGPQAFECTPITAPRTVFYAERIA